jgi:hypothetical protein
VNGLQEQTDGLLFVVTWNNDRYRSHLTSSRYREGLRLSHRTGKQF